MSMNFEQFGNQVEKPEKSEILKRGEEAIEKVFNEDFFERIEKN